jgi:glycosyltransferase involved in cell wall biosynthesis
MAAQLSKNDAPVTPASPERDASAHLPTARPDLRVAITHDFMETYGGAERVTEELAACFPHAPVYAILGRPAVARRMNVESRFHSMLPPRPALLREYRWLAPAFPLIVDAMRVAEADVLLSSSYAFAHRLRTRNDAPQVCYCHSPLRFAWSMTDSYRSERAGARAPLGLAFDAFAAAMRASDRRSSRRVARYLTQAPYVADQISRFYGRPADVVGAPVDCSKFRPADGDPDDYFLLCGRLIEPYKRVRVAIEAFRRLGRRLVVAGDGPSYRELVEAAPPNVEFTGHLGDEDLIPLMQRCQAAIFPSRDDFGLIPVEVMACGRPVLAYGGGGALYTVLPGVTGELFDEQSSDAVEQAVLRYSPDAYDGAAIRRHALQWDRPRFRERVIDAVESVAP